MNPSNGVTFHDPGTDLGADAKLGPAALHGQQVVGLHHAGLDALHVHGANGAQVDHLTGDSGKVNGRLAAATCRALATEALPPPYLALYPLLRQDGGGVQTVAHVARVADQSHVSP